jgi:hypothetical protein
MADKITFTAEFDKDTKGAKRVEGNDTKGVGSIYLRKESALKKLGDPEKVKVTIEAAE